MLILATLLSANRAYGDSLNNPKRAWAGEWRRHDVHQPSTLTISDITAHGFKFSIDASTGVNVGSIDGKAKFDKTNEKASATISSDAQNGPAGEDPSASEKKSKPCQLSFSMTGTQDQKSNQPMTIAVLSEGGCDSFGGTGVTFDGGYITERVRPSFKPSFDCAGKLSKVEAMICETSILAAADREMSRLYHSQESDDPFGKDDVALKKAQTYWLRTRNEECGAAKEKMLDCLVLKYRQRIGKLRQSTEQKGPPPSTLRFTDFIKSTIDESRDALWNDAYVDLYLFEYLGQENHTALREHFVRFADTSDRKPQTLTELDVFATMQGDSREAGIIVTAGGCLWAALPIVEKDKFKALIYGPKSAAKTPPEKLPEALRRWIDTTKDNSWLKAEFKFVFPQKC